jgi:hypothetical protein
VKIEEDEEKKISNQKNSQDTVDLGGGKMWVTCVMEENFGVVGDDPIFIAL